tara:strand:+ start:430 stop:1014 length:585 start_codon:yes stop_codon:yes gene_type:complete
MIQEKLVEKIRSSLIPLQNIPHNAIQRCLWTPRGRIPEIQVRMTLDQVPGISFDVELPMRGKRYKAIQGKKDIEIHHNGQCLRGFEYIFYYKGMPFVVEVKASKLNGYSAKIPRSLELAQDVWGQEVSLLLCYPFNYKEGSFNTSTKNVSNYARSLEQKYPHVFCINLGYQEDELNTVVRTRNATSKDTDIIIK